MTSPLFSLAEHTILLSVSGSRAYGMARGGSDVDVRGVLIPPAPYLVGCFRRCDQVNDPKQLSVFIPALSEDLQRVAAEEKLEGTIYTLQKYLRLAADGNPNMLEILFTRDQEVVQCTPAGARLREARQLFLSTKVRHTFLGYGLSQLKRIQTHRQWLIHPPVAAPSRAEMGLPDRREKAFAQLYNIVQKRLDRWSWNFSQLTRSEGIALQERLVEQLTEMGIAHNELWRVAAGELHCTDQLIERLKLEREYERTKTQWDQYQLWTRQRNAHRAELEARFGYDTKHAAHLVRLLRMGYELLTEGVCRVWRGDHDAEELLSIRDGAWSYDQLIEWTEDAQADLINLDAAQSPLPSASDLDAIETLCQELILSALRA